GRGGAKYCYTTPGVSDATFSAAISPRRDLTDIVHQPKDLAQRRCVRHRDEPMHADLGVLIYYRSRQPHRGRNRYLDFAQFVGTRTACYVISNPFDALGGRFKISEKAVPAVSISGGAFRSAATHPADDNRRVRLLYRTRLRVDAFERKVPAFVSRLLHRRHRRAASS